MWAAYLETLQKVFADAALLKTRWQEAPPMEGPLTMMIVTGWIWGGAATVAIFVLQFFPILSYITQGVAGLQWVWVAPVAVIFTLVFFLMAWLMLSAGSVLALFLLGGVTGLLFIRLLRADRPIDHRLIWNMVWDSVAISILMVFPIAILILVKWHLFPFSIFIPFSIVTLITVLFFSLRAWAAGLAMFDTRRAVLPKPVLLTLPIAIEGIPVVLLFVKLVPRLVPWLT